MKPCKDTKRDLIRLAEDKRIYLEGSILKVMDADGDEEFQMYLDTATEKDKEKRRRGLELTKQMQTQNLDLQVKSDENKRLMEEVSASLKEAENDKVKIEAQNRELLLWKEENERISEQLKTALDEAEDARKDAINAKEEAENDLDILQKKTQFELIGSIVKVALWIIMGVGVATTLLYMGAIFFGKDTHIIGPAWSNLISILLTNAFSIVGTIMGVKYATDREKK
jgi:hypothetical protein